MAGSRPEARDPATVQRILRERAQALARPLAAEDHTEMVGTVGLAVGVERYAVELQHVVGIEHGVAITPVPGTPRIWAGLANVRGAMRPILDLREYLRAKARPQTAAPATVILVAAGATAVGLLCDDASDVVWIRRPDITAPPLGRRIGRAALRGITPDLMAILNLEVLLADPALVVEDERSRPTSTTVPWTPPQTA